MAPQPKRMRLGTKSCTECRRRKVKCTFDEGQSQCQQCTVHSLVCQRQQVSSSSSPDDTDHSSKRFHLQTNYHGNPRRSTASGGEGSSERPVQQNKAPRTLKQAPLFGYFKTALSIDSKSSSPEPQTQPLFNDSSLEDLLPNRATLANIFEHTEPLWLTWPLAPIMRFDGVRTGDHRFPGSTCEAMPFVEKSLRSSSFGTIAKCLVWLSLCLQELPKDFKDAVTGLPLSPRPKELIHQYLTKVETFYQVDSKPVCSLDFVEALALQYEIFIFMGRPSKAWKSTRAGIDNAMLLGLHRPGRDRREKLVWETLWVQDRHLSLFLGLPYSVPEHFTSYTFNDETTLPEQKIMQKLALISGHISERDQLGHDSPYSKTARLIEEMDELKAMIPEDWGTLKEYRNSFSHAQVIVHRDIRLFYQITNQMVHLPYVQLAAQDKRYEYNRTIAFESAEGTIKAYQNIRKLEEDAFNPKMSCDFLDFIAFMAAAILAVDLVAQSTPRSIQEEKRLWTLILNLARGMRKTAEVMDCTVVEQSADVLEYLYAARHGTYTGPEDYEVTIPYFGKIKISRPPVQTQHSTRQHPQPEAPKNVIELQSNAFNFRLPNDYQSECELTENWAAGYDYQYDFDWQGVFEFNGAFS